jgi:hypothetical protein
MTWLLCIELLLLLPIHEGAIMVPADFTPLPRFQSCLVAEVPFLKIVCLVEGNKVPRGRYHRSRVEIELMGLRGALHVLSWESYFWGSSYWSCCSARDSLQFKPPQSGCHNYLCEGLLIRSWDFNTRVTGVGITPEPEEWRRSQDEAQPEGLLSFAGTSAHSEAYQLK